MTLKELSNELLNLLTEYPDDADTPISVHVLDGGDNHPIVQLDTTEQTDLETGEMNRLHSITLDIDIP